ncbi:hypothetical protein ACFU7D_08330 [Nocardioides sp. NPDC057577]|uniref:hypothetical protein n=1 Tax=Nocardioides sp. NPDC057577 TaxID=3346171 RepID=UPI00366E9FAC
MEYTASAFNEEFRAWVRGVTGSSVGELPGHSKSINYKMTSADNLLVLPVLRQKVEACAPKNLAGEARDAWVRRELDDWEVKWRLAERSSRSQTRSVEATSRPKSNHLSLPRARVTHLQPPGKTESPLAAVLDDWLSRTWSNLMFISGSSGSGKTTEIRLWMAQQGAAHYLTLLDGPIVGRLRSVPQTQDNVIVIDDFDPFPSLANGGKPDLSKLRSLFAANYRCIVLSRRNPKAELDNLAQQLRDTDRLDRIGAKAPEVVLVRPLTQGALRKFGQERKDAELIRLADVIPQALSDELASPMVLRQLSMRLDKDASVPKTRWEAYSVYLSYLTKTTSDDGSHIPPQCRHRIYQDIAWSICTSPNEVDPLRPLSIPTTQVGTTIMAQVREEPNVPHPDDLEPREWTTDFLRLDEIFRTLTGTLDKRGAARFTHQSYYEFFVAAAITARLRQPETLDLKAAGVAEAIMDSPVMTFLKPSLSETDHQTLEGFCAVTTLPWLDRLLYLYLLEERPGFRDLLARAPADYWAHLESARQPFDSRFLQNAILYQRVVAERATAWEYVRRLRADEKKPNRAQREQALAFERDVQGSSAEISASLVARLTNPELKAAIPITVFRLGQMGDESCISVLKDLRRGDRRLDDAVRRAVAGIERRQAQSVLAAVRDDTLPVDGAGDVRG